MNISELTYLLQKSGVQTRRARRPTEVCINCFKCGDTNYKMYVNPTLVKYGITGHCHCMRRDCYATLEQLARHFGIDLKTGIVETAISTFDQFKARMGMMLEGIVHAPEPVVAHTDFNLDQFQSPLKSDSFFGKKARNYLHGRNFTDAQIEAYDLRFAVDGDYAGRIIIPFYENKEVVYIQARSFLIASKMKVLNPKLEALDIGKSHYLYNFDQARRFKEVIITESWGSSIAAGYNAVGINGNTISPVQLDKLTDTWENFIVLLDHGVEDKTFAAIKTILFRNPYAKVRAVFLPYGDPNEIDQEVLHGLIENAWLCTNISEMVSKFSQVML